MRKGTNGQPIATKLFPSGAWEISDIIDNQRVHLTFYGSKRDAIREFRGTFYDRD